jgi:RNA polymerase sigma-70 factor (ECF subfamily)
MKRNKSAITDDTLLLRLLERGCKAAFNELYNKYREKAYSDAYRRLKNAEDAKDIVQEVFIQIWMNRERVHKENVPAYLHVAIRNKVIKYISKQKLTRSFCDVLTYILQNDSQADGKLLWKEALITYETLLSSLPPKRQVIFRLHFQENLSTKEISTQLGISRKTVQNQLAKAIESIKIS